MVTCGRWTRQITILGTVIALGAAACGGTSNSSAGGGGTGSGSGGTVSISDEYGETWNCQFNPYNPSVNFASFGPVYEELVYMDSLKNGATTPWLATNWGWSSNDKRRADAIRPAEVGLLRRHPVGGGEPQLRHPAPHAGQPG